MFRHPFGDDIGIHRPQLSAKVCQDLAAEPGRGSFTIHQFNFVSSAGSPTSTDSRRSFKTRR
jgi:hypothetical protein